MILFEQNCYDLKWPLLAETCSYVLLLNTIINQYYHSCGFTTDIYLTIRRNIIIQKRCTFSMFVTKRNISVISCIWGGNKWSSLKGKGLRVNIKIFKII